MFLSKWREFPSVPCRKKKTWWQLASRCCWNRARPWHASELVSFLVGLRTYLHPVLAWTIDGMILTEGKKQIFLFNRKGFYYASHIEGCVTVNAPSRKDACVWTRKPRHFPQQLLAINWYFFPEGLRHNVITSPPHYFAYVSFVKWHFVTAESYRTFLRTNHKCACVA